MKLGILLALLFINIPVYLWAWRWAFGDRREFYACLKYWFMPDLVSLLRGEYLRDAWSHLKLFLFLFICLGAVALEFLGVLLIVDLAGLHLT